MAHHRFCRDIAIARGEPAEGTGALSQAMMLVRWPRGKWASAWDDGAMSPPMRAAWNRASEFTPYVTLVDRVGETEQLPQLLFFPQSIAVSGSEEQLIAAIDDWIAGRLSVGTPEPRLTIICCTDSAVDACCARFGFATYKALLAGADREKFNILQCSHIGGCHFAASLAVPARRERYGRLEPQHVPAFLASMAAGEIYLPAFRGRADLDEPGQVADLAARRWAAKSGGKGIVTLGEFGGSALRRSYRATVDGAALAIELEARDFSIYGGCSEIPTGAPNLTLRWLVREVVPQ